MCGIVGFFGRFDSDLLPKMTAQIAHRGPDGGHWITVPLENQLVGLGHRRLSIIDLSTHANQPMWSADGRVCIVYNGEIYNYLEIKKSLINQGVTFRTSSDTEVLLQSYLRYGLDCFKHLNGIYSFAIWDAQSRTLLIARDNLGVKPLYYAQTSSGFIFSSEIKSLLQSPALSLDLDATAIQSHLTFLWCPGPNTLFKSVKKLGAGTFLLVQNGEIKEQKQFYRLPQYRPAEMLSPNDALSHTAAILSQAVERQMVSDVPIGTFLSGGLDSSSIAYFAQKRLKERNQNLPCFTMLFPSGEKNLDGFSEDIHYARKVAEHIGAPLYEISLPTDQIISSFRSMIYHLDEPLADFAPLNVRIISEAAKKMGIGVLLSGAGGDDVFSGYRRHVAVQLAPIFEQIPISFRRILSKSDWLLPKQIPFFRRVSKMLQLLPLDGNAHIASHFGWLEERKVTQLLSKALACQTQPADAMRPLLETLRELSEGQVSPLEKMLVLELSYFLTEHNLLYTDKMGMAAGVEIRVPFLDLDLVTFASRIPAHLKQNGRVGKWILKKAMEPYLPHSVIYRSKTGFGVPLRSWLEGPLAPLLNDTLSEHLVRKRGLFDHKAVAQLRSDHRGGRVDAAYTLLSLAAVETWCQIFVDRQAV